MAIKHSRISVIGCGWLGFPLAKELVRKMYKVKGSTRSEEKLVVLKGASIQPYQLKLSDELYVDDKRLFDCDIAVVNIPPGRGGDSIITSYSRKIALLLEELKTSEIEKIIFISSTGVYQNNFEKVSETTVCKPDKPSGQAVLSGERVVQKSGLSYTIVRLAGLVGGSRQPGNWFKGKDEVPGGDTPVNMVHQEDCINTIIRMVEIREEQSDIYNICADKHPLKKEFYDHQSKKIGVPSPSFRSGVLPHKIVSNQKFKDDFGYTYVHPDPNLF